MGLSGNSRRIPDAPPDPRVPDLVRRHAAHRFEKPIQAHNQSAFDWLSERIGLRPTVVIDAGCGTGVSTLRLADRHPKTWVVGVDKSAARLSRGIGYDAARIGHQRGRILWVRADLVDFWRLALAADWRVARQYLLYPNPWPKPAHLSRRWHGHPVFPTLLTLSRTLTLRTNWRTYAEEFGEALATVRRPYAIEDECGGDLTPFEAKYRASGHRLTELRVGAEPRSQAAPSTS